MQFGFCPGKGTIDAIFVIRQVQEKFLEQKKDLWIAFVDLEKAFDRVPREVLWWSLRRLGVEEWMVAIIKALYNDAKTSVRNKQGESKEFEVKVGVHQGSVLSPLLFSIVLEALSREFREGLPWELLYADDLALMAKTKDLKCRVRVGQKEDSGKWPCGVCRKGVGSNSIYCVLCKKWIHKACSGMKGKMTANANFQCSKCTFGDSDDTSELKELSIGNTDKVDCVDRFCYLGDMIWDGGGVEEASRARVRCAWSKFMELAPILTLRGASLTLKGKIYKICVQRVFVYGSETWAAKADDIQRLQRTERAMVRWMCGVKLEDRRSNKELLDRLQVVEISTVVSRGRLGWYDHVERMPKEKWVSKCRELEVEGD